MRVRDELLLPAPRTEQQIQKELSDYYGMISEVDVQIGRIMEVLRATGQAENTIVVFASDNGLAVGPVSYTHLITNRMQRYAK